MLDFQSVMASISGRTNMPALNASVESTRAGGEEREFADEAEEDYA